MSEPPTVAVVGAGVSGLAAAWELVGSAARPRVFVLEATDRVGGRLVAAPFAGRLVDLAADAFLARRPEAVDLARELGLEEELVPAGVRGAAVWAKGRLRPLPSSLVLGVPTRWWPLARSGILSLSESLSLVRDMVRPHRLPEPSVGDRSVGDIVGARLGRPVVERLVDPLVGGIHAGSVDELSAAALFPLLLAADQQSGSLIRRLRRAQSAVDPSSPVFLTLQSSTASLAERLAASLRTRGVTVRLGTRVDALERLAPATGGGRWRLRLGAPGSGAHPAPAGTDHAAGNGRRGRPPADHLDADHPGVGHLDVDAVLLATPATSAGALLARLAPRAAGILSGVDHASVATLTLALPPGTLGPQHGTGFLVPRTSTVDGRRPLVTAITYLDRKWPHLARDGHELVRMSVGRHGDLRHTELDDDELVAAASSELASILASPAARDPIDVRVTRWPDAFPQFAVGHLLQMAAARSEVEDLGGLALAGSACSGVGIPACITSGREAARRVVRELATLAGQLGPIRGGAVDGPAKTPNGPPAAAEPDPAVRPERAEGW